MDHAARNESKSWDELRENSTKVERDTHDCLETAGGNDAIGICLEEGRSAWDDQLNDVYGKLMKDSNPGTRNALQNSERKWIGFKVNEEKLIDRLGHDDPDNFDKQIARLKLTKDRAVQLEVTAPGNDAGTLGDKADDCLSSAKGVKDSNACITKAIKESDDLLNKAYGELRENLSPAEKEMVRKSQLKWLDFRDAENIYADRSHPANGKNMNVEAAAHKIRINEDRADELWMLKTVHGR